MSEVAFVDAERGLRVTGEEAEARAVFDALHLVGGPVPVVPSGVTIEYLPAREARLVVCPRCRGGWWTAKVCHTIPSGQHPAVVDAVREGRETPGGAIADTEGMRVLYVCATCSFPGIEPHEDGPYYEQGAGR